MNKLNIRALKEQGAELAGENRTHTRPIVLLYCGVLAVLTLGCSGLNLYLSKQISGTGGLGGIGLRSVLQTAEEILNYINIFFGPYWSAGFLAAMLAMVRGRTPKCGNLTAGFRKPFRLLAHMAFDMLLALVLLLAAVNLGSVVFAFTPLSAEFSEIMVPLLSDPNLFTSSGAVNLEIVPVEALSAAMVPMVILISVIFIPMYVTVTYGFRLSLYLVMERDIGAVQAHFLSARMMRGRKLQMLKLDLSFWWYYVLMALAAAVGYLDVILALAGITAPLDPMVMFFGTLVLYCGLSMALSLWKKCEVDAAYVLAFEQIAYPEPVAAE